MRQLTWAVCAWISLGSVALAADTSGSRRKVYEWVDAQGITHYGDQIPPEYAAQEHRVINGQGIEIEHTDAQKTPEQLAEEDKKRLDAAQRANRDRNLLNTYVSVQEIEHLRDQRLTLLSDQIKVTGQFLDTLNKKMGGLRLASARFRPYSEDPNAPPMSDQMAEDLVRVGSDIRTQEDNLREKRSEEAAVSRQFESDIARFKELKGIH
ncbi:MAG TPA: DUF4124 domain-containing protein [Steroidobacteraceae bacterium]|nr:DUF4124 domain-containing protein [Steroidobacteraceae bacterium]